MTFVAEEGARPSPRPTSTRETHSASRDILAAGGATSVPTDQKATPARSTVAPPILQAGQRCVIAWDYACGG